MKKILIVDDVAGWRLQHKENLEKFIKDAKFYYAESARDGYNLVMENVEQPFDIIITDLQMECDFEPKYAGEWFVEQIKTFKSYVNSTIVISSAAYNIREIANLLNMTKN